MYARIHIEQLGHDQSAKRDSYDIGEWFIKEHNRTQHNSATLEYGHPEPDQECFH